MNIRKARQIAFDLGLGRFDKYSAQTVRRAFNRLDRSQPEKQNPLIIKSDRAAAQVVWDNIHKVIAARGGWG